MFAQAPADPTTESTGEPATTPKPGGVQGMVKDTGFIVWSLVFAGMLLVCAVIFFFFDRWRKKPAVDTTRDVSMSLNSFKEMYENGEITEAEYEKIKLKWAAKLKEKAGAPFAPPEPPPAPPPAPPAE